MSRVKATKTVGVGWLAVLVVALGVGSVWAQTVQNGSFEAPALDLGSAVNGVSPDFWTVENPGSLNIFNTGSGWLQPIPDGSQGLLLLWVDPPANPALLWQNLGATMSTGTTYTLSAKHKAGYPPGQTGGAQTLYMYIYGAADNTSKGDPLATAVYQHPGGTTAADPYQSYSLSFTCDAANNGKYLSIGIGGGRNHSSIDQVQVTTQVIITGTVVPSNFPGNIQDVGVTIELIQDNATVVTQRQFLDANGRFSFQAGVSMGGTYKVAVKATSWLRKVRSVTISGNPCDAGTFALTDGDADGDNSITSTDLSVFLSNMD